jgi:hypothetical protein
VGICHPSYWESKQDEGPSQPGHKHDIVQKINTERAEGMAQVIECLLSKHEALSSNLNTAKTKRLRDSKGEFALSP